MATTYKTGEKAPWTGDYRCIGHTDPNKRCTINEEEIPLSRGEVFPPHKSCNTGAYWNLIRTR